MVFSAGEYAELLGLYLGDGHIVRARRTHRLRISLDTRHAQVVSEATDLLRRCFPDNGVGVSLRHEGAMAVVSLYSGHLTCLFPQHGSGLKHTRRLVLEPWQEQMVEAAPWAFLRGCVHSDGCFFINRTGPYTYLSVDFTNRSSDLLSLFTTTCELVGVEYRRYERRVRIYRRESVAAFAAFVGLKR